MMAEAKFRADHVGSLLRPEPLLAAQRRHEAGEIDDARLRAAEDAAIGPTVARQLEAGIDVVTDGEFRRRDFRTGFVDAVDGFTMTTWMCRRAVRQARAGQQAARAVWGDELRGE